MNVTLYGGAGRIGTRILNELLSRGHKVKAVVRDVSKVNAAPNLTIAQGDLSAASVIADASRGSDVIISSYGPKPENPLEIVDVNKRLVEAVKQSGVPRLITVGGAASLEVAPGRQLFDEPTFPEAWKGIAGAHREALKVLKGCDINWTCLSPATMIMPGERTGKYRTGTNNLVVQENGKSEISMEDYAIAIVDEMEKPKHERMRFSVGY